MKKTYKPMPVLHTIPHGASEYGIHYYLSQLDCQKKAMLKEEMIKKDDVLERSGALTIGIIGHYLMELYFKQEAPKNIALEYSHAVNPESLVEAERIFTQFRVAFPDPKKWGRVIATEWSFPKKGTKKELVAQMHEAVGADPFTGRMDLVLKMQKRHIEWLKAQPDIDWWGHPEEFKPGVWLVDHKFEQRSSVMGPKSIWNPQFTAYMIAWNMLNPKMPCRGLIRNSIHKAKTKPGFGITIVPYPTQDRIMALHQLIALAVNRRLRENGQSDPSKCYGWGECEFKSNGMCKGY